MPLYGDAKRAYQLKWINDRRDAWIELQGGCCGQCGSTAKLEVDHIDRSTKLCNPRNIWSRTKAFRDKELAKCQVLCNNCHNEKTLLELTVLHPHGTYTRYTSRTSPCRCDECTATVAPYWRQYRASKAA